MKFFCHSYARLVGIMLPLYVVSLCLPLFSTPSIAAGLTGESYQAARKRYLFALSIPDKAEKSEALKQSIIAFEKLLSQDANKAVADRCTYLIAQCHHHLHDLSHSPKELEAAIATYRQVVERYPSSPLADDAQYLTGILLMSSDPQSAIVAFKKVAILFPKSDMKEAAAGKIEEIERRLGRKNPPEARSAAAQLSSGNRSGSAGTKPSKLSIGAKSSPSLARQLGLGIRCIVLDPGHGGKDKGAISSHKLAEKDITLTVARLLQKQLENQLGCRVLLTRTKDEYISLEKRTQMANNNKADLFISIHVNAHEDPAINGMQTYYLDFAKDQEAARVAGLENAPSGKSYSDLKNLLERLLLKTRSKESASLAEQVHHHILTHLKRNGQALQDLGIRHAPFQVLLGAEMPCILLEIAFITNERDELRLTDKDFRNQLTEGIVSGIAAYMAEMKNFARAGVTQ